jgi:transposase
MAKRYDVEFKQQAVRLVLELHKPSAQPFVGSGRSRAEDQAARDLQQRIRDFEEENAILKKAMRIFPNDRK